MARFTDNEIEKLKQSISLVALLQRQGFDLKKDNNIRQPEFKLWKNTEQANYQKN